MLKKVAIAFGLFLGAFAVSWAVNIPLVPSSSPFSEPSQIVGTLNTLINTLQGQPTAINNNAPAIVSIGSFCTANGATPQTCNGQRGAVTFTGVTAAANTNATAQVVSNSLVTAASSCNVTLQTAGAANSGPVISSVVPTAGTLTITLTNATATSTGSFNPVFNFNCFQ